MKSAPLPKGWSRATLGELLPLSYGKSLPEPKRDPSGDVPVYGSSGIVGFHIRALIEPPAIIVGRKGSAGSVFLTRQPSWPIDTVYFTHGHADLDLNFWAYLLELLGLRSLDRSTAIPGLSRDDYSAREVPVPPAPEQRRIVAAIEEHLSRLDAAVAGLKRVQAQLPRYRAAVLKAAADQARCGEAWRDVPLSELAVELAYGTSARCVEEGEVPVLRMGNIEDGRLVLDSLKYLPANHSEFPRLLLEPGDLLFNRTNSAELVGKTAVYHGIPRPCSFASYLIRVRPNARCLPDYLATVLNSPYGRGWIGSVVSQQVGQANVSGSKLKAFTVPLPSLSVQRALVADVEQRTTISMAVDRALSDVGFRAAAARQSILRRAFEGKLAPQDPNDEPASVLLERIRAARATAPPPERARRRRRT